MGLSADMRSRLRYAMANGRAGDEVYQALQGIGTPTGRTFFVQSTSAVANDSDSRDGLSSSEPLATWAEAYSRCTANNGDCIVLLPGHNENIGSTPIALNVAGVTTIGIGSGAARPRFDYDHASASVDITANSTVVQNVVLFPSVTDVLIGIDVNAAVTGTVLEDIEAIPGEDGAGVDDFALGIDIKAGCSRTRITNYKQRQHASGAGYIAGIRLTGASDDVIIENPDIVLKGAAGVAPINGITTLSTNVVVRGVGRRALLVSDDEPGIELLTGTTGVFENVDIFTDLATIAAATVADGVAHFNVRYVEVGNESDVAVKTASVDD